MGHEVKATETDKARLYASLQAYQDLLIGEINSLMLEHYTSRERIEQGAAESIWSLRFIRPL